MANSPSPGRRDRYVDLLRVVSLGVVVVGHWLMAVILVGRDGAISATNALALLPSLRPLTWLLQVMPVFFFVGGFSHATALPSVRRRGGGYADFARSRAGRLLRPTAVFVAVWLVLALAVEVTGHDRGVVRIATRTVAQPLWFVGVYLGVVALAPAMLRMHRWCGRMSWAVPATLAAGAGLVDVLRFGAGVPDIGYLNVALVWLAVHQVGYLYADGRLTRRIAVGLVGTGLAATVALTAYGPYPTSMVGLPGERVSNLSPPTFALVTHSAWLIGLVLLLRAPVSRWLCRPRVWRVVIMANGLAMTAFLWHLTAMFVATAGTVALGLVQPAVGSLAWWLLRPAWIAVLMLLTGGLVVVFRRADRPRPARVPADPERPAGRRRTTGAAAGMALCAIGVLGFSAVGFGGLLAGRTASLVVLPVTPLLSAALLAAGAVLLRATRPRLPA
jgi:Acyltransferase family